MRVFRLCNKSELEKIAESEDLRLVGKSYKVDPIKNTHQYQEEKRYMHFFEDEMGLLYLSPKKGKYICIYDIPDEVLEKLKGYGNYADFIDLETIRKVTEYAVPSEQVKMSYLRYIYIINEDLDFDYVPNKDEIYRCLSCMMDLTKPRNKPKEADFEER